jgi:hypothetical protein
MKIQSLFAVLLSTNVLACAGTSQEPKTANYNANANAQADAGALQPDKLTPQTNADAGTAAQPDAQPTDANAANPGDANADSGAPAPPDASPPSEKPPVIQVVLNGLTTEVVEGQTYAITSDRMLFFYSAAAAPDCSNVEVQNLIKRPLAGLCQIGFLPQDQQLKKDEERPASIAVGTTRRSFRVKAL